MDLLNESTSEALERDAMIKNREITQTVAEHLFSSDDESNVVAAYKTISQNEPGISGMIQHQSSDEDGGWISKSNPKSFTRVKVPESYSSDDEAESSMNEDDNGWMCKSRSKFSFKDKRKRVQPLNSKAIITLGDSPVISDFDLSVLSNDDGEVIAENPTLTRSQTSQNALSSSPPTSRESKKAKRLKRSKRSRKRVIVESSSSTDESIQSDAASLISMNEKSETDDNGNLWLGRSHHLITHKTKRAKNDRLQRVNEQREREYNELDFNAIIGDDFSANKDGVCDAIDRESLFVRKAFVLDNDCNSLDEEKCPVVVHRSLSLLLKPHQVEGIQFLYDVSIGSLQRFDDAEDGGGGGILAHSMGLGKTLQVIAFLHSIFTNSKIRRKINRALVIVPKNVVLNWKDEFEKWLKNVDSDLDVLKVIELDSITDHTERLHLVKFWHDSYNKNADPSVLILGYELFKLLVVHEGLDIPRPKKSRFEHTTSVEESDELQKSFYAENLEKYLKKVEDDDWTKNERILERLKPEFRRYLQGDETTGDGPHILICDEGHRLKSARTILSKTMSKIRTKRKIFLTGTPMQNNLKEYYCMVNFVKPLKLLGTKLQFKADYRKPIDDGKSKDASNFERKVMMRKCFLLANKLAGLLHRADYATIAKGTLPPKREFVIYVRLTERQITMIRKYIDCIPVYANGRKVYRLVHDEYAFYRICAHPYLMLEWEEKAEKDALKESVAGTDETDFLAEDAEALAQATKIDNESDVDGETKINLKHQMPLPKRKKKSEKKVISGIPSYIEVFSEFICWCKENGLISTSYQYDLELSNKLFILIQIIKICERIGDKLLIFTKSIESLDFIEATLNYLDQRNAWFVGDHTPDKTWMNLVHDPWHWQRNKDYFVISGATGTESRREHQFKFNDPENLRARLMLISTKAGSLGTNLIGANRVVIFDVNWNPSHDTQALFRVYRFGQKKPVYVYRLVAQGCMEEIVYNRDVTKESIFHRVIDERPIDNHFYLREIAHEIDEFYIFEPDIDVDKKPFEDKEHNKDLDASQSGEIKDRLLLELLRDFSSRIVKYQKHDSLFDEFNEARLTEEERENAIHEAEMELLKRQEIQQAEDPIQHKQEQSYAQDALAHSPSKSDLGDGFLQKLAKFPGGMPNEIVDTLKNIKGQMTFILGHLSKDVLGERVESFFDIFDPIYEESLRDNNHVEVLLLKLLFVLKTALELWQQQSAENSHIIGFIQDLRAQYATYFASIEANKQS